ncbi:rcc01693 family protein [Aquicoccus sp. G2-2]|uniref:rcc01693 family protein n=1 Tax=Aquicoccus sp. G2-2 TaxID=3092120 RepID=UPI002ADFEFE5|nr:rcc01693 family protein [Aquicoccus sp. G2-2]MEA1112761.1 rcc01693 family protein [Aquicoccus sp. G2-2]
MGTAERGGFDWPALMRAGMRGLGLRPDVFWALTPVELEFLLGPGTVSAPLDRARLDELLSAYPDDQGV